MDPKKYWKKPLTTAELLEEIEKLDENDVIPDCIYITPPENRDGESDEDSGDEDCNDPNRLNYRQLQAEASSNLDLDEEGEEKSTIRKSEKKSKKRKIDYGFRWEKGDLHERMQSNTNMKRIPAISLSEVSEPLEFLELFLSPDVLEILVTNTVRYAASKNYRLELGNDELLVFISILYISGYVPVPSRRMFWESRLDVKNILVSESIRRNRFEEIFRFIHAADNDNLVRNDKMAKLRPLLEKLNELFIRYVPISEEISIDESMIPYFGRNGCKQFIRGKPIRFGYKAWVLAQPTGYCVNFDIYQGRNSYRENEEKVGLGESVVMNFANLLKNNFHDMRFSLFFDNFFTSANLIKKLGNMDFNATGTVRDNRTGKCPCENSAIIKKKDRGTYDFYVDHEHNNICVKWKDNSVVTLLSNQYGVEPLQKAARYSVREKSKIEIPQPNLIRCYNKYMGGVDLMDNNISNYRISFRGKKWYIPILFWTFDVCMNNAWILARQLGKQISNLEFRRQVVIAVMQKFGKPPIATGPRCSFVSSASKLEGQHLIVTGQKRRRCAVCKNKTTKICRKCMVSLHDKCFLKYHS